MGYKYYHDAAAKTVYCLEYPPIVAEEKDRRGKRTGWIVQGEIIITRADNMILPESHRWKHRVREHPQEHYDARDDRGTVVEFFETHYLPNHTEVDEQTYRTLRDQYEQTARQNKPALP